MPFDFDYSGLVDAEYALPPEGIDVRSVRMRRYRGFCHPQPDWAALFETFFAKQEAVFGLVESTPGLGNYARRRTERYLEGFYQIISTERLWKSRILGACRRETADPR